MIEDALAPHKFSAIREFVGHGIGTTFHTYPLVYHFRNASNFVLLPGMTFTIEPMVSEGRAEIIMWPDRWTVATADGSRSAQFEHTLLITDHGAEILTAYE